MLQTECGWTDLGPYTIDYTSSGRYMLTAGRKGHLAIMDMHTLKPVKDFQVTRFILFACFLLLILIGILVSYFIQHLYDMI